MLMKFILFLSFLVTLSFASISNINSFEADFKQIITDEKDKQLTYSGHLIASKPQNALWHYMKPIKKEIYIRGYSITIIEPEIEQVIIKELSSKFDFFRMIKKAKKVGKSKYTTINKDIKFTIYLEKNLIKSISYIDEFDNNVEVIFTNQKQNKKINTNIFYPIIPEEYDIVRD